jgi:Ser/Thr protein kinase RdoA (MazF antagonist)
MRAAIRRITGALPALRRQLLACGPLGSSVIHVDLDLGNVVLQRRRGHDEPVVLDGGRARTRPASRSRSPAGRG